MCLYIVPIFVHRTKHYLDGTTIDNNIDDNNDNNDNDSDNDDDNGDNITMLMWVVLLPVVPLGSCIRTIQQYIVRAHSCIPHRACLWHPDTTIHNDNDVDNTLDRYRSKETHILITQIKPNDYRVYLYIALFICLIK